MMKPALRSTRLLAGLLWLLAASLSALPLYADVAATADIAGAAKYSRGLLWRIERDGGAPSYLFGTLHSDDPRVVQLAPPVRQAFDRARSFTMEVVADADALLLMAQRMFYQDGRTLAGVAGDALYRRARQALAEHGLPDLGLERQKPWVVVMALSMPPQRGGPFLDMALQAQAAEQKKSIHGLETVAEQLAVFDDLPDADQVALLKETLDNHKQLRGQIEALTTHYLARDLAGILKLAEAYRPADSRVYDTVMRRLLADRNLKMLERMRPRLAEGNAFIAVGAGHLAGPQGLLVLLERAGYRLHAVY